VSKGLVVRQVLVVDDNPDSAMALAEFLKVCGHRVEVAHDGRSALALAGRVPPDVAILDIGLPHMDGYELAGHLRAAALGPIELIAMTGYGEPEDLARSLAAGFNHHLTKPVDPQVLRRLIGG
jgi:two-component system CheB/CheR fusion protein